MRKTAAQEAYVRYKTAQTVVYDAYGNAVERGSNLPVLSMLLGAGLGGAAAHTLPNEKARALRDLYESISPESAQASLKGPKKWGPGVQGWKTVDYQGRPGEATRFKAPAHVAKRFYQQKALGANASRLLAGLGIGALGGYLGQKFME